MTATTVQARTVNAAFKGTPTARCGFASRNLDLHAPVLDSVERGEFVNAMSTAVTGVNVVTTDGHAGRFGITVSAMASVSADPPMVLVCINQRSPACTALRANLLFCVNVLSTQQRQLADTFAGRAAYGEPYEFEDALWMPGKTGVPRLAEATSIFECVVETAFDSGSHTVFIGRVIAASKGDANPLLYTGRAYGYPCQWA